MAKLVLVRHGESVANAENVYTGWNDVALSKKGILQAKEAGRIISNLKDFSPTHIHTSLLSRAIITANIIAEIGGFLWLPITKTWRLNERHYGALKGINKEESKRIFGIEQVKEWRRGFDSVPPKLENNSPDRRYQFLDPKLIPRAESLHQTQKRLMPYFEDQIAPYLVAGQDQLIVAHGSSLRALIKKLENIDNHEILNLEVPNAQPIVYEFDKQLNIKDKKIFS
ncbi:2,3-bisphosphoglycerate-dependent phosphoglycerate mutase [Lactobacillus sp. PV037]|uniref:2,3-bisphosphoglycerate-dependent phosphoglycerate mutase n=1 Tax=unclassified Lactobacillus TaxID=2620435 RepID=UPI00223F9C69|nr:MULTISPECIES: 2,3-bisphosphoglycerate-dependent phosphoglycerate mutase [unclassified Lactobacillus]QNQ81854.1 2,3-bisphosphoglycerate-dependent phosphoglycerate mutase [Lactobacillus sp. PV012]QNQ84107.1 2,3-bisphosphoglycerate-dependent phosphoglycerate mutase [Lactobacillus sp. PV037]